MKKIKIYQEETEPIMLEDENDDRSIEEYTKELSNLMNSGNISMLLFSNSSVTLRPSKLVSFYVEEVNERIGENQDYQEDVITDVE